MENTVVNGHSEQETEGRRCSVPCSSLTDTYSRRMWVAQPFALSNWYMYKRLDYDNTTTEQILSLQCALLFGELYDLPVDEHPLSLPDRVHVSLGDIRLVGLFA